ncbi:hypothetical protein HK105_208976, partial [Polyrhizophydium stewartii]
KTPMARSRPAAQYRDDRALQRKIAHFLALAPQRLDVIVKRFQMQEAMIVGVLNKIAQPQQSNPSLFQLASEAYKDITPHTWPGYSPADREKALKNAMIALDSLRIPRGSPEWRKRDARSTPKSAAPDTTLGSGGAGRRMSTTNQTAPAGPAITPPSRPNGASPTPPLSAAAPPQSAANFNAINNAPDAATLASNVSKIRRIRGVFSKKPPASGPAASAPAASAPAGANPAPAASAAAPASATNGSTSKKRASPPAPIANHSVPTTSVHRLSPPVPANTRNGISPARSNDHLASASNGAHPAAASSHTAAHAASTSTSASASAMPATAPATTAATDDDPDLAPRKKQRKDKLANVAAISTAHTLAAANIPAHQPPKSAESRKSSLSSTSASSSASSAGSATPPSRFADWESERLLEACEAKFRLQQELHERISARLSIAQRLEQLSAAGGDMDAAMSELSAVLREHKLDDTDSARFLSQFQDLVRRYEAARRDLVEIKSILLRRAQ